MPGIQDIEAILTSGPFPRAEHILMDTLSRMEKKTDQLVLEVNSIKLTMARLPCDQNRDKITLMQKIVYGAVGIILVAFLLAITGQVTISAKNNGTTNVHIITTEQATAMGITQPTKK